MHFSNIILLILVSGTEYFNGWKLKWMFFSLKIQYTNVDVREDILGKFWYNTFNDF